MSIIEVKNLYKIYKSGKEEFMALKNIGFSVEKGELIAIVGTSGSGKSSLMNILGCLDPVRHGKYWFSGKNVDEADENELANFRNTNIGFIFQSFNLLPKMTMLENVALPLVYSNFDAAERLRLAEDVLVSVGLGDRLHHLPGDISGGQRQRVAIARALVNHPHVLLADEPTGNLDTQTEKEILVLFDAMRKKYGTTIIIVTHDEDVAMFADRIITLFDGFVYGDIDFSKYQSLKKDSAE